MKQIITAPGAPAALGPYSHAVQVGDLLFTSGQVPLVPETGKLAGDSIEAQANQVLDNLEQVLRAAGLTFDDVVKTTIFLTDLADFATVNAIYATRFPSAPPARSCVQVAALPAGAKMEMELIASK
ncbi:MAG: RidA family protein [Clostridiales bacterium]|nr:RidA family protein [Clostridiales bacterium]MCD7801700.1 RidA family protein [Clostridiales bacterium]